MAGYKELTTSKSAAEAIERSGRAWALRKKVIEVFNTGKTGTADEIAEILGESILSIRPRCSELYALGLIEQTGIRRPSSGGKMSHVWKKASEA
jgi:predicted transcriptional regulator